MYFGQHSIEIVTDAATVQRLCPNCGNMSEHVLVDQPCGIGFGIPFTKRPFWSSHRAYYLMCPVCTWGERVSGDIAEALKRKGDRQSQCAVAAAPPERTHDQPGPAVVAVFVLIALATVFLLLVLASSPGSLTTTSERDLAISSQSSSGTTKARSISLTRLPIDPALTGREEQTRARLLTAHGGNGTTEASVQMGLEWLAQQQDARTGLWSLTGPYSDGGGQENQLAATAMALLAFQGAGNTHKAGKYERNVSRGIETLVRMQDNDGNFFPEGPYHHHLYSQAQATIAICELYGMTKDPKYLAPAQKALDYASRIQTPGLGGWRYVPRQDVDTSVTGWFVMALQSGLMAGLDVQSPTLDAVSSFLDKVTKDGSTYGYQIGREPTLVMTAEALLCRQYLGWQRDDPRMLAGVRMLLDYPVDYDDDENVYYWYYATQTLHHMGGDEWDQWNKVMRERIPARQVRQGAERGSWNPGGDRWGAHGGRLFTTCLSIYNLQVYYRHLPIYTDEQHLQDRKRHTTDVAPSRQARQTRMALHKENSKTLESSETPADVVPRFAAKQPIESGGSNRQEISLQVDVAEYLDETSGMGKITVVAADAVHSEVSFPYEVEHLRGEYLLFFRPTDRTVAGILLVLKTRGNVLAGGSINTVPTVGDLVSARPLSPQHRGLLILHGMMDPDLPRR
jgi:hypothetical protein